MATLRVARACTKYSNLRQFTEQLPTNQSSGRPFAGRRSAENRQSNYADTIQEPFTSDQDAATSTNLYRAAGTTQSVEGRKERRASSELTLLVEVLLGVLLRLRAHVRVYTDNAPSASHLPTPYGAGGDLLCKAALYPAFTRVWWRSSWPPPPE